MVIFFYVRDFETSTRTPFQDKSRPVPTPRANYGSIFVLENNNVYFYRYNGVDADIPHFTSYIVLTSVEVVGLPYGAIKGVCLL